MDCFPWPGRETLSPSLCFLHTAPAFTFWEPSSDFVTCFLGDPHYSQTNGPFDSRCSWACRYHLITSFYHPSFHRVTQAPKFPALSQNKPFFLLSFPLVQSTCSWEHPVETSHNCWIRFQPERSGNRLITVALWPVSKRRMVEAVHTGSLTQFAMRTL